MLLELCKLARREQLIDEPEFEMKPIHWIVRLKADGTFIAFESTLYAPPSELAASKGRKPKKTREIAKRFLIPRQFVLETGGARTSGDYAYFLVDKAEYIFGLIPDGKGGMNAGEKSHRRQALFLEKLATCAAATDSQLLHAVIAFLNSARGSGLPESLPKKCGPSDLFAFMVLPERESLVHELPEIREWWTKQCREVKGSGESRFSCLVTGVPFAKSGLFPGIKGVPGGATTGSSLVSFNAPAFESYGWESSENAPIDPLVAQEAATALNRLLDPAFERADGSTLPRRRTKIGETTALVYWAASEAADPMVDACVHALEAEDQSGIVGDLIHSLWKGKPLEALDPTPFYAVTLSGAQGRIIVRDHFQSSVGQVFQKISQHFEGLELPPLTRPGTESSLPPALGLPEILSSLVVHGDRKRIHSPVVASLFRAALTGVNYPLTALHRALERQRAEVRDDSWQASRRADVRAGLIKAFLTRNFRNEIQLPPLIQMDALNKNPGYLLGRLLACYGEMQKLANLPRYLNVTVVEKYYGLFSISPQPLLHSLDRLYLCHLKSARKNQSKPYIPGSAINLAANVDRISAHLDPGQTSTLTLVQQAQFVLGFHHQRHWFKLTHEQRKAWIAERKFDLESPETILVLPKDKDSEAELA